MAYLGLGANLEDPCGAIGEAIARLDTDWARVVRRAPLYETTPIGPPGQPDYVNTVVEIETTYAPAELLVHCKAVEEDVGRTPSYRWGPREIDVDILLYDDAQIETPTLCIPHRELHRRRFALVPLGDLAPERCVPGIDRTVRELADSLTANGDGVVRMDPAPA